MSVVGRPMASSSSAIAAAAARHGLPERVEDQRRAKNSAARPERELQQLPRAKPDVRALHRQPHQIKHEQAEHSAGDRRPRSPRQPPWRPHAEHSGHDAAARATASASRPACCARSRRAYSTTAAAPSTMSLPMHQPTASADERGRMRVMQHGLIWRVRIASASTTAP